MSFSMTSVVKNLMFQVLTPYPVGITINGAILPLKGRFNGY